MELEESRDPHEELGPPSSPLAHQPQQQHGQLQPTSVLVGASSQAEAQQQHQHQQQELSPPTALPTPSDTPQPSSAAPAAGTSDLVMADSSADSHAGMSPAAQLLQPAEDQHHLEMKLPQHPQQQAPAAPAAFTAAAPAASHPRPAADPDSDGVFIHALLPHQLAKTCVPTVSITRYSTAAGSKSSREQVLVDKEEMQLCGGQQQHLLTHWCIGPISLDGESPEQTSSSSSSGGGGSKKKKKRTDSAGSTRVTYTATVAFQLPRQGWGLGARKQQLEQELLLGSTHQFVLQPCCKPADQHAAVDQAAELLAAMTAVLVQQLQAGAELAYVIQQLADLLQHCNKVILGASTSSTGSSSLSSYDSNILLRVQAVVLLAQHLQHLQEASCSAGAGRAATAMDWQSGEGASSAGTVWGYQRQPRSSPTTATAAVGETSAVLIAYMAVRVLGQMPATAVKGLDEYPRKALQHAVSLCLQTFTQLADLQQAPEDTPPSSSSVPSDTSAPAQGEDSSSSWKQQLHGHLSNSITGGCIQTVLACCDLQEDVAWLAALPALVGCMQQPSLSFLYQVQGLPGRSWRPQHRQQPALVPAGHFAAIAGCMFEQLAGMHPELLREPASMILLSAVLTVAPGLLAQLQLSQRMQQLLQHVAGQQQWHHTRVQANTKFAAAIREAMQQAPLAELLHCWSILVAQGQGEIYRSALQQAVVTALTAQGAPAVSSTSAGRRVAAGDNDEQLLLDQLLHGDLFNSGQLLQLLCSSPASSWPPFVSLVLMPSALQQQLQAVAQQQQPQCGAQPRGGAAAAQHAADNTAGSSPVKQRTEQLQPLQPLHGPAAAELATLRNWVKQWLLRQPAAASSTATTSSSSRVQLAQLYCAADSLIHACPAGVFVQQQQHEPEGQALPVLGGTTGPEPIGVQDGPTAHKRLPGEQPDSPMTPAPDSDTLPALDQLPAPAVEPAACSTEQEPKTTTSSSSCPKAHSCSVLDLVLQVLADAVKVAVLPGRLQPALQAAGQVAHCCELLQQHFLANMQLCVGPSSRRGCAGAGGSSLAAAGSADGPQTPGSGRGKGVQQHAWHNWEVADVFVSALLGCRGGQEGVSSLVALFSSQGTEPAGPHSAAVVGEWEAVSSKRQRQAYSRQSATGVVPWLQQQLLLLLADCILAAAADPCGSYGSSKVVICTLLQGTQDLLASHSLWVKLLHGLQGIGAASAGGGMIDPHSTGEGSARPHEPHSLVQQVLTRVSSLCEQVQSGSITVQELQQLQQDSPALLQLVGAAESYTCMQAGDADTGSPAAAAAACSSTQLQAALVAAEWRMSQHQRQQQQLEAFYSLLCPSLGATADLAAHVSDFNEVTAKLCSSPVQDLGSPGLWGMHWAQLQAAGQVSSLLNLTPFLNSCRQFAAAGAVSAGADAALQQPQQPSDSAAGLAPSGAGDSGRVDGDGTAEAGQALGRTVAQAAGLVPKLLQHFRAQWQAATVLRHQPEVQLEGSAGASSSTADAHRAAFPYPTTAAVLSLWASERVPDVAAEYAAVQHVLQELGPKQAGPSSSLLLPPGAITLLLHMHCSSREGPLAEQLAALQPAFGLSDSPLLDAVQLLPQEQLTDVQLPALQVSEAFEAVEAGLGPHLVGQLGLLQQLGRSAALQDFLRQASADDLRRMVDGAEDHGDSFVRGAVQSDLLEVNRLLQQLRPASSSRAATLEQLLSALHDAAAATAQHQALNARRAMAAPTARGDAAADKPVSAEALAAVFSRMAAQLQVCNENIHSFRALYSRLAANRAELTREVVSRVLEQGVYQFEAQPDQGVSAVCTYAREGADSACSSSTSTCRLRTVALSELQELRSRVMLLVGSLDASSATRADRPRDGLPAPPPANTEIDTSGGAAAAAAGTPALTKLLSAFAQEVAATGEITATVSQLLELGCFSYKSWQVELAATPADPLQRLQQLQQLLAELQQDLGAWKQELAAAYAASTWLNFFQPRQLFLLQSLLRPQADPAAVLSNQQQQAALAVLQFADSGLTQQRVDRVRNVPMAVDRRPSSRVGCSEALVAAAATCRQLARTLELLFADSTVGDSTTSSSSSPQTAPQQLPANAGTSFEQLVMQAATSGAAVHSSSTGASSALITVAVTGPDCSSMGVLLQARADAGLKAPRPSEVVFCSSSTSWWEVQLLLQRCFPSLAASAAPDTPVAADGSMEPSAAPTTAPEAGTSSMMHVLCNADALSLQHQAQLVQLLKQLQAPPVAASSSQQPAALQHSSQLLITCSSPASFLVTQLTAAAAAGGAVSPTVPDSTTIAEKPVRSWLEVQQPQHSSGVVQIGQLMHAVLQQQGCCVVVVSSDLPGQGKTAAAERLAASQGKQLYHVLLADAQSASGALIDQMQDWDREHHVLHIELLGCSTPAAAEQALFSLLVLSHLTDGERAYHRAAGPCCVVVEVGNSAVGGLLLQMPVLAAAQQLQGDHALHRVLCTPVAAPASAAGPAPGTQAAGGFWQLCCSFQLPQLDLSAPELQLLCTYLALQEAGQLDRVAVVVQPDGYLAPEMAPHVPGADACRRLLQAAFTAGREASMTYSLLHTYVSIAALQLRHMSCSGFFQPEILDWVHGGASHVRSQLLTAILQAAAAFAADSSSAARCRQRGELAHEQDEGLQLAARSSGIVRWSDSNHLLLLFNAADQHQSITALYRQPQHVPQSFRQLLQSQAALTSDSSRSNAGLVDYAALDSTTLLETLLTVVTSSTGGEASTTDWERVTASPYVLTADNLLKMALIHLRVQADLPVITMGDTGCAKTSLLSFLAATAGVQLVVLNVHGGTTCQQILAAVDEAEQAAMQTERQVWLFLDEANTCSHQGLLASIISHRQLPGNRRLHNLVVPLAAINPYRLKPLNSSTASTSGSSSSTSRARAGAGVLATAGLIGKLPSAVKGLGRLVYTVNPLPETAMDHVWDFGVLSDSDERCYITAMAACGQAISSAGSSRDAAAGATCCSLLDQQLLVNLLCTSQQFIRSCGQEWDVSLRDVKRCIKLASWFETNMRNRPKPKRKTTAASLRWHLSNFFSATGLLQVPDTEPTQQQVQQTHVQLQALVLALLHTYHSRLPSRAQRQAYLLQLVGVLRQHGRNTSCAELEAILRAEQEDYLRRMELPAGIAINDALRENVFVTLVCLLNKIPLFLVGKPGSSKSLALRLIHANLRGPDSPDDFFRLLPSLLFFSFQGSESSTSEGITKTFAAAKAAAAAAGAGTIAVVLLDEVGLAEISPHNPLKALHAELEPGYPAESPDVAVVGISNWALDAAKVNRAVLLSRPEPEEADLATTATTIWHAAHSTAPDAAQERILSSVAAAYYQHYCTQSRPDFHGLRDFYAVISTLRLQPQLSPAQLYKALLRNFGGPAEQVQQVIDSFSQHVVAPPQHSLPSVLELIKDNLHDKSARHLLLIGADLAVDVVRSSLSAEASVSVIWGSPWPEDQTDAFKYNLLGRIILHMELGHKLILWDCGIFSSLYDMLNQNYSTVGGQRNCRIALGPHANPLCAVHEDFRCVVVMTPAQADAADPSLLNRFEKQWLLPGQLLPHSQQRLLLHPLQRWMDQLAAAASSSSLHINSSPQQRQQFSAGELFLGLHDETLPSLVLSLGEPSRGSSRLSSLELLADSQSRHRALTQCQEVLTSVASLDGVARACYSYSVASGSNGSSSSATTGELLKPFFERFLSAPKHSIRQFVATQVRLHAQQQASSTSTSAAGCRTAATRGAPGQVGLWCVMTRSGSTTLVAPLLGGLARVTELLLQQIRSESELRHQLTSFLKAASAAAARASTGTSGAADGGAGRGGAGQAELLVLHADVPAASAQLRHLRSLVLECITAAGLIPAAPALEDAAAAGGAAEPAGDATVQHLGSREPLVAVCVVCHVPVAAAASSHAHTATGSAAACQRSDQQASSSSRLTAAATGPAQPPTVVEDGWQANYLGSWQLVTIDAVEGVQPWLWQVLHSSINAAAGLSLPASDPAQADASLASAGLLASAAPDASLLARACVAALPLEQLMRSMLLRVLCSLPYPNTQQAALRVKALADKLLAAPPTGAGGATSPAGAISGTGSAAQGFSLWATLQAAARSSMLQWCGWEQLAILQPAGDAAALQMHGSFVTAAEAVVTGEMCRLLGQLLLGLERHHVLDSYWIAQPETQQVVLELLCSGDFTVSGQPRQTVLPLLSLQLPASGLCYSRLQAASSRFADLELSHLLAEPQADTAAAAAAVASHASSGDPAEMMQYRLDALLVDALHSKGLADVLAQHPTEFAEDLLLLSLAEEGMVTSRDFDSQQQGPDAAAPQEAAESISTGGSSRSGGSVSSSGIRSLLGLLRLLLLSRRPPGLRSMQHPVLWMVLIQQHRQHLRAFAHICSVAAAAPGLDNGQPVCAAAAHLTEPAATDSTEVLAVPLNQLDTIVWQLYQAMLPTQASLAGSSGVEGWRVACADTLQHLAVLQPLLSAPCKALAQNLECLLQLAAAAVQHASSAAADRGMADGQLLQLLEQLQMLAKQLQSGTQAAADAATLGIILASVQQLQQAGSADYATATGPSSSSYGRFVGWLLQCSLDVLAADTRISAAQHATTAAASSSSSNTSSPSELLQLVVNVLLGPQCTAALLPQLLQLLTLSVVDSWQVLLGDMQSVSSQCPVWKSLQVRLQGCCPLADDTPVALLVTAIQQHWFSGDLLDEMIWVGAERAVAADAAGISCIEGAGKLLCRADTEPVQLAVSVAFLRAVVDTVAPALSAPAAAGSEAAAGSSATAAAAAAAAAAGASSSRGFSWAPLRSTAAASNLQGACDSSSSSSILLHPLAKLLGKHRESERVHSLLLYLLKVLKGDKAFAALQQIAQGIAQQAGHPLQQCFSELLGLSDAEGGAAPHQQHLLLPLDPYKGMPGYGQVQQLLAQAAAFPASAAELLQGKVREATTGSTAAQPLLAAVSRQLYLTRGLQSEGLSEGMAAVRGVLEKLLRDQPGQAAAGQLLQSFVLNRWHNAGSSSSSGSISGGVLCLQPGVSQQQLYLCALTAHLGAMLVTSEGMGTCSSSNGAGSSSTPGGSSSSSSGGSGLLAPLLTYLTDPESAAQQLILGMPGDEATQVLNSTAGQLDASAVYRCACGMKYLIGDCGNPATTRPCPNCQRTLGGSSHTPAQGQARVGTTGHLAEQQQRGFVSTIVAADSTPGQLPAGAATLGVRDLSPSSCQLLRLLVHAALLLGSAAGLQPPGALRRLLGAASDAAAQEIMQQVLQQQWQLLRVSCQASEEQLLAVVHSAIHALGEVAASRRSSVAGTSAWQLTSDTDRRAWEQAFQQHVAQPLTSNPSKALQQLLSAGGVGASGPQDDPAAAAAAPSQLYVQCAVQEGLDITVSGSYRRLHLPTLFRSVAHQPSLDALAAHFWSDPQHAQRYPVTLVVLQEQQQQGLQLLPHLSTLAGFEAGFRRRWGGMLSRAEARSVPLLTLLQSGGAGSSTSAAAAAALAPAGSDAEQQQQQEQQVANQAAADFVAAWNAVGRVINRYECRDVAVPVLDLNTAPAAVACLASRDEGLLLLAMLSELAQRQNRFLQAATVQEQQQEPPTAADLNTQQQQQQQRLSTKPVQLVQPADIVDVSAALQQLQQLLACPGSKLAWAGLEYGRGQALSFDLDAVEQMLSSSLVQGKCMLAAGPDTLQEFVFAGETFLTEFTLLHQLQLRVTQQDMPAETAAELAAALLQQLQPLAMAPAGLLPHLEVLLSFVRKTGGDCSSSVAQYVMAWLPDGESKQLLLSCSVLQQVQLCQLVSLYEALEDTVAAAACIEDSISSCYNQPLGKQLEQQVWKMVGLCGSQRGRSAHGPKAGGTVIPAAAVIAVLLRLMLRFLRHSSSGTPEQQQLQPEVPLSVYCCNPTCCRWPWQQFALSPAAAEALLDGVFPAELLLAHACTVVKLLR